MRFRNPINTLLGQFCCNRFGWHDGMISLRTGTAVCFQESALFAEPALSIVGVMLHDLGSKCEGQLVILTPRRCDAIKYALRPGPHVLVNNSLVLLEFSWCEQWGMRRTGWRSFVNRIQDRIFDNLARWCVWRRIGGCDGLAVW